MFPSHDHHGSASFADLRYEATVSLTTPAVTFEASAVHVRPEFSAETSLSISPIVIDAVAAFSIPERTANAALTVAAIEFGANTVFVPLYVETEFVVLSSVSISIPKSTATISKPRAFAAMKVSR